VTPAKRADDEYRRTRDLAVREMIRHHRRERAVTWVLIALAAAIVAWAVLGTLYWESGAPTFRQFLDGY
jgi:hypothetical protein